VIVEFPTMSIEDYARAALSVRAWDFLPEAERIRRLNLGLQCGLDVYDIRAGAWGIVRTAAKVRILTETPNWKPFSSFTHVVEQ
jgi:hypothetical protein